MLMQKALERLRHAEEREMAEHDYVGHHARRFDYLLDRVGDLAAPSSAPHILDVGGGPMTGILRRTYDHVTTLGYPLDQTVAHGGPHIPFDLNTVAKGAAIDGGARFDVVIFAEVVEHLHIPADAALLALREVVKDGGWIIVQTPNAAELMKRVALLRGRNPYETLRLNAIEPGHFREYTGAELRAAVTAAGFVVVRHDFLDYFQRRPVTGLHPMRWLFERLRPLVPEFREGQTIIAQAVAQSA